MTAIYTYKLKRPCGNIRPFCRRCTNSFAVDVCGPSGCETEAPSTICLESRIPDVECDGCGHPVAVYFPTLTYPGFDGETITDVLIYNIVLPPGNPPLPCVWYIEFPNTEEFLLFPVCGSDVSAREVKHSSLRIDLKLAAGQYHWELLHTFAFEIYSLEAIPDCFVNGQPVEVGSIVDSGSGFDLAQSALIPIGDFNCDGPVTMNWGFGADFAMQLLDLTT